MFDLPQQGARPACGPVISDTDISRFLGGLLLRLAVLAFAIALTSAGHGVNSTNAAKALGSINQVSETGARR